MTLEIKASATIGGAKTNRVRVHRKRGRPRKPTEPAALYVRVNERPLAKPKRKAESAGTAMRRYRQDPTVRGLDTVVIAISLPVGELAELDEVCERVQMARSHFLRRAAKHFAMKVAP